MSGKKAGPAKGRTVEFRFGGTFIRVNVPDRHALLREVAWRLAEHRGFTLATINLDHIVKLHRDRSFRSAYAAQELVVADGNPVVWLSRRAGRPVSLVPGSDLVLPLAGLAAAAGVSVALVGSTPEALERAAQTMTEAFPGLKIAAHLSPPMGFDPTGTQADALLSEVAASGAGLCFIALGAPKQEVLAARGRSVAPGVGFASVGAGLDFLAGRQSRAPAWVRAIAMEWLWRMLSNPRRMIPRYAACAAILPREILRAFLQRHRARVPAGALPDDRKV